LKTLADTYQKAIDDAQSALNARQTELDTIEDDFANAQLSAEEKAEKIASYLQGVTIDTAKGAGEFADITPRKVAELAGTAAQEALKASATLAANAVVSAFDTVARPIAEGVHTFAGKVVDEIFGVIDQARDFAQDTALPALETAAQALQDQITQIADEITKLETKAKSFSDDIDNLLSSLKTHSDLNFLQDYVTALQKRKALVDTTLATLKTAYTPLQNNLQDIKTKLEKIENDERTLQQDEAFTIKNLKIWIEDIIALFNLIGTQAGAVQEILKDIAEVASNLDTLNKSFVTEVTDEIEKLTDGAKQAINQAIKEGLTNVDVSIKAAETTINTIVDEIIARLPALKTALKGAVDTALKNLTEYAKDEIEKALTEALKQLKDRLDTIAKNIIGEIEEAVSKDIDKLHQTLE
jgi:chromosome segregation ATPase